MALELEAIAQRYAPSGLVTIGQIDVPNSSRNTIAGKVRFTVDLRHPDDAQIDAMERDVRVAFEQIATQRGLQAAISTYWKSPATVAAQALRQKYGRVAIRAEGRGL